MSDDVERDMVCGGSCGKSRAVFIVVVAGLVLFVVWGISFLVGPDKTLDARYEIRHLDIEGAFWSTGEVMNDHGQIAGCYGSKIGESQAYVWDEKTGVTNLHASGWTESRAVDINNLGQVAGVYKDSSTVGWLLFFWDPEDGMTEILSRDTPGIWVPGYFVKLNNHGQAVGSAIFRQGDGSSQRHAFLWDRKNGMKDMGTGFLQGKESIAWGITDSGQVVGGYVDASGNDCVFIGDEGAGMKKLEMPIKDCGSCFEINDNGQVAGRLNKSKHICLWDSVNGTTDLTDIVAVEVDPEMVAEWSFVRGLNQSGEVVGRIMFVKRRRLLPFIPSRIRRTFVFRAPGDVVILESQPGLTDRSFEARDINNEGAILVTFYKRKGRQTHPGILTPIELAAEKDE